MSTQTPINLNQTFHSFSDVQAFFGNMLTGFVLATEWTTCDRPSIVVTCKGESWIAVLKDSQEVAPMAASEIANRAINTIKTGNESVKSAIHLETLIGGGGRYEWDVFYTNPFGGAIVQIINLAALCCKNKVNPAAFLSNLGYETPLTPSKSALEWA
jgi:hypothetical protein